MPDSPTFRHLKKGYSVDGGERDTHAVHVQSAGSDKFNSYVQGDPDLEVFQ